MNNWHVMYSIVRVKQVNKYFRPDRGDSRDIAVCHLAYYLHSNCEVCIKPEIILSGGTC